MDPSGTITSELCEPAQDLALTEAWLAFKTIYPKRAGTQRWSKAERAFRARLADGFTWKQIIDGAKRYAVFNDAIDKTGSTYVMQAVRFVGPERPFLEPWIPPPTKSAVRLAANLSAAEEFMQRTERAP